MYENKPIMSILSDQSITLDFVNSTSSSKTESAFTRTKVRIEAILKLLTENLSSNMIQVIPYPIANFLNNVHLLYCASNVKAKTKTNSL